jgi:acetoacetate decarboxylase
VLPRPLEFTEPHVRINFAQVDMPTGPLGACTISVKCRHDGIDGTYDLLMVMTVEGAVLGGRETFGEPKKVGDAAIVRDNDNVSGVLTRKGIDIVEVRGQVTAEVEPQPLSERHAFYFKFMLDPSGDGFDSDPVMVDVRRTQEDRLRQEISGQIILTDSPFDPVADLPVREVLSIVYTESHQTQTGEILGPVPQEWIWPFRHQRYDGMMLGLAPR